MFSNNIKILVVDDMGTMRKLVKRGLGELGFTTMEEAEDGQVAWTKLNDQPDIGLVISDWNMPNCTGLDLLKRVRADGRFKTLPFVLLTAEVEAHQVKEALVLGVDGYIIKPFTGESLKAQLEKTYLKRAG